MMSIELQLLIVFPVLIGAIYIVYKMFKSCIGTAFNKGVKSVLFNPDYKTDCSQDDEGIDKTPIKITPKTPAISPKIGRLR